jgi:hypothetical protein
MANGYFGAPAHLKKAVDSTAPAQSAQERCDAIQAEFRAEHSGRPPLRREPEPEQRKSIRREPPPLPAALTPTDDPLKLRLADELDYARRMLDAMGDTLSADPLVVGRHMTSLQTVDIAGQILGHIANVIRSSDPKGAVDLIGMCDLKGRLKRSGGV